MQDILKLIKERQSARGVFDLKRQIAQEDMDQILEAGRWAPNAHNVQNREIVIVNDQDILAKISNINTPLTETFLKEHYASLSLSKEEFLQRRIGLLNETLPPFLRYSDDAAANVNLDLKAGQTSPTVLFFVHDPARRAPESEGDFVGIISIGCALENMWLMANSLGIGVHLIDGLCHDPAESEVKKVLGIPANMKIAVAMALGYPAGPAHEYLRVRRDVKDFCHYNRW